MRPGGSTYCSPTRKGGVMQKSTLSPSWGGLWPQQIKLTPNVSSNAISKGNRLLLRVHESGPQTAPKGALSDYIAHPTLTGGAIIKWPFGPHKGSLSVLNNHVLIGYAKMLTYVLL